ncbi:putative cruzipain precursor [Trypanosoma cruzi]|nr:putative cruzipain precursor [Trypanosoma cruzi]
MRNWISAQSNWQRFCLLHGELGGTHRGRRTAPEHGVKTPRCKPDAAQYQASKIVARTPRGSKVEDTVLEAKLQPLPDARHMVMLCVLVPPSSATRSTPPENLTTSSWPCALRFGQKLAARASRDGAAADGPDEVQYQACDRWIARHI